MKVRVREKFKRVLKKTGLTLSLITLTGTITTCTYNAHLNNQLDDVVISQDSINKINEYYGKPTIFVMNDSQGLNLNLGFWKNSFPEYLEEELNARVIDASSLRFNKVCHVNMLLDNNLSIEEMKKLNSEGAYYAFKKLAKDKGLSIFGGLFGNVGECIYGDSIEEDDSYAHISDLIKESDKPIIIFSSGANDLMFLLNANPNSIGDEESNKYKYAQKLLKDPNTIDSIILNIDCTLYKITSINPNSRIFVLSLYTPNSLESDIFKQAIEEYNSKLKDLCEKCGYCYIDETELATVYGKDNDFHIDVVGHKKLASLLIDEIASNTTQNSIENEIYYTYDNDGINGYYEDLIKEINKVLKYDEDSYSEIVYQRQREEKDEDSEICKKLIK